MGMRSGRISIIFILLLALILSRVLVNLQHGTDETQSFSFPPNIERHDIPIESEYYQVARVVDGDTIRLQNVSSAIRLLCVDTEEVFRSRDSEERMLAYEDWDAYVEGQDASDAYKYPTPWGGVASRFAEVFFSKADKVRIEYDSEYRKTGFFDRALCYIFIIVDRAEVNFNVELVRWGYSPYYAKYGYSEKYHDDFIQAENEARERNRGIWNPKTKCYPDYDQRIEHWNYRADQIRHFNETYLGVENYFDIMNEIHWGSLDDYIGEEITLFGSIGRVRKSMMPYRAFMEHKRGRSVLLETDSEHIRDIFVSVHDNEAFMYCTGILNKGEQGFNMYLDDHEKVYAADVYLEQSENIE